jgi:lipopolysaccharide/colanic/teichoic acid biosynthesis glycosyltransferase
MQSLPGPSVTAANDSRILPLGRILRRWKLDELPQFFNIVTGEMSIVGPRPKLSEHTLIAFPCKPGLTSIATIAFISEETLLEADYTDDLHFLAVDVFGPCKATMDGDYVASASFTGDLLLIVKTIRLLAMGR